MQFHDACLRNDILKINETMLYAFCHVYAMMYEREMLLKCIFVWENKSLTTAREFWEAKSRTIAGDEEYMYLQPCLECFRWEFLFVV